MSTLTRRQLELLRAFIAYEATHKRNPSFRELASTLGRSVSGIRYQVGVLVRLGHLEFVGAPKSPRAVRLSHALPLPLEGQGRPRSRPTANLYQRLYRRLADARISLGLSPPQVAARIAAHLGLEHYSTSALSAAERGEMPLGLDVLDAWAQAVGMVLIVDAWPQTLNNKTKNTLPRSDP